jgi:tetratricopeptide (TPR) repeat protein
MTLFFGAFNRHWGFGLFATLALLCTVWAVPVSADTGRDSMARSWERLLVVTADPAAFEQQLDELLVERDLQGLSNLESAAIALAQMADDALSTGDTVTAQRFSNAAVAVAPVRPEGYLGQSAAYWDTGNFVAALSSGFNGAWAGIQHYWVGTAWLSYLAVICWLAAATTFVVLLVPSLLKGLRTVQHFLREAAYFRAPAWITGAGAGAIAVLPVAAGLGFGWIALVWTSLAWLGDDARQRRVQLLLLLLVLMGPWLCAPFLSVREPLTGPVGAALSEGRGGFMPGEPQFQLDWDPQTAGDWRVAFALGNTALRSGHNDQALNWYQRAEALGGDPVRISNNIATAHYQAGRAEQAEALYKRLSDANPAPVLSLLNLGQVQSLRLDFDAARDTLARAQQADPGRYLKVMTAGSDRATTVVIPYPLSHGDSRAILLSQQQGWDELAAALWRVLFGPVPVFFAPLMLFVVGTLFWVLPRLLRGRRVDHCDICRTTICPSCLLFVGDLHLCRDCGDRMADTQGTEVELRLAQDRFSGSGIRPGAWLARIVPGLAALGAGRYGTAGFHLFTGAFLVWWMALLGTIPEWALGVSQNGWPVARAVGLSLLLLYVGWTFLSTKQDGDVPRYSASSKRGS